MGKTCVRDRACNITLTQYLNMQQTRTRTVTIWKNVQNVNTASNEANRMLKCAISVVLHRCVNIYLHVWFLLTPFRMKYDVLSTGDLLMLRDTEGGLDVVRIRVCANPHPASQLHLRAQTEASLPPAGHFLLYVHYAASL